MTTLLRHLAALAAFTLSLAGASPASAQTQATAGGTNASTGLGFGCATGTSYQMVNGIAKCRLPATTAVAASSCSAAVLTQGSCSFRFPATTSGSTPSVSTSTGGYTGQAQATCSNGVWASFAGACDPSPCSATSTYYGSCAFDFPTVPSGSSPSVSTSTSGYIGTGQATCTAGSWSPLTASCAQQACASGSVTWNGSCRGSMPSTASGTSVTVANVAVGYDGSANFACTNGSWQAPSPASCSQTCASSPAATQTLACPAGQTGAITQTRSETCNASTGWAWNTGAWTSTSNTCVTILPPGPPSYAQVTAGLGNVGCDDMLVQTKTGTYTYTVTWDRSIDGRGYVFGNFVSRRVEHWIFDGNSWSLTATPTDSLTVYHVNTLQYCR